MPRPRVRLGELTVGFVQPLAEALQQLGHDPTPLLERYGLTSSRLAQPGARLSIPRYMHLGHAAIKLSGEPALGLRMGSLSRLAQTGLAGVTAAQAPTLGEAARTLPDADRYAEAYRGAIARIAREAKDGVIRSPGMLSGMPGGYGVSSTAETRPSSSSTGTRSTSQWVIFA